MAAMGLNLMNRQRADLVLATALRTVAHQLASGGRYGQAGIAGCCRSLLGFSASVRQFFAAALLAGGAMLPLSMVADAHSRVRVSDPPDGATLATAPTRPPSAPPGQPAPKPRRPRPP